MLIYLFIIFFMKSTKNIEENNKKQEIKKNSLARFKHYFQVIMYFVY